MPTVRYGERPVLLWALLSSKVHGNLFGVHVIINSFKYQDMLNISQAIAESFSTEYPKQMAKSKQKSFRFKINLQPSFMAISVPRPKPCRKHVGTQDSGPSRDVLKSGIVTFL
ncbi:hypothetical protein AMECASPLE_031713 [Ameca splendens]|uniref:Uncharacterized protein n=1 Tax=Ameca splendens TaxID=208324 RepID=A0ABV0Z492_9TELE